MGRINSLIKLIRNKQQHIILFILNMPQYLRSHHNINQEAYTIPNIDQTFLKSPQYKRLMSTYLPFDGLYDIHEAQNKTMNFCFRHFEANKELGVFRWRGIQENLDTLLPILINPSKCIVDFGGAANPLGFNSILVDQAQFDIYNRPVNYHSLAEINSRVDVIFSSHCLEHILPLNETLEMMARALDPQGLVLLHLPSFSCERWRAGIHKNIKYNDHVWTFGLKNTAIAPDLVNYINIDDLVSQHFKIKEAKYCGDDSIFIIAEKPLF